MSAESFLTQQEELEVIEAIREAERATSGEIRVHLESSHPDPAYDRAREVFHELGMDATDLKNGVLIYVAVDDHAFAICGDQGINEVVPPDFWDCTRDIMQDHFRHGNFKQGLIEGIARAGEKLKTFFPWQEGDKDELSNEISRG